MAGVCGCAALHPASGLPSVDTDPRRNRHATSNFSLPPINLNKMKKLQLLLLIVLTISACKTQKKTVSINGTVTNKDIVEIMYSATFNETFNGWFKDSVIPDSSGHFTISVEIDKPCFIGLQSKRVYKRIIIEPGKTYEIEIGGKKKQIKLVNKSDAQVYYDDLSNTPPNALGFFPQDLSDYKHLRDSLNMLLDNELQDLSKVNCSEPTFHLIASDRQAYYKLAMASLASQINVMAYRNNEKTSVDVMKMWGNAVSDTFLIDSTTKRTSYFYDLLNMAFWYKLFEKPDYDSIAVIRSEKRKQGLIHSYNIELAESLLPEEIFEFYFATYIQSQAKQRVFEKELINISEQFKTDYPKSKYTSYIQPSIDKIVNYYTKVADASEDEYRFIDNYENINTLADCLFPLKGSKIYVDIWSTSCGPCKDEFEYNKKLKETLKNKGVEILYISLDGDQNQDRWKNMIKYYNLKGNHIRANQKLKTDLREIFGSYGTPRYLIVDKQGNIVNRNAPRPSNLSELEKQL